MEKHFKLVLYNWDRAIFIFFLLVLLLTKADLVLKEGCSKKNPVKAFSFGSSKVILTLLTEVIAFYIGFSVIYVYLAGFQRLVLGLLRGSESLSLQNGLENLLQVLLGVFEDRGYSGKDNSNK